MGTSFAGNRTTAAISKGVVNTKSKIWNRMPVFYIITKNINGRIKKLHFDVRDFETFQRIKNIHQ